MQQPTCTNLKVQSLRDALRIFAAVKLGLLRTVSRHLNPLERQALCSGCIYVWEERKLKGSGAEIAGLGIERFTDGRRWSNSQERGQFLFYYEKYSPPPDSNISGKSAEVIAPSDWKPLVKQTCSVWVKTDEGSQKKWHLTAYFSQASVDRLNTVDEIPHIRDLAVLEEVFKSTRMGKNQRFRKNVSKTVSKTVSSRSSPSSESAPFPTPYPYKTQVQNCSKTQPESQLYTTPHPALLPQTDSGHDGGAKGSQPFPPHQPSMGPVPLDAIASFDHLLPSARQEESNVYHPYSPSPQYLADLGVSPSHLSSVYNTFGYGYPTPSTTPPLHAGYLSQNCTTPNSAVCGMHLSLISEAIQYPLNPMEPTTLDGPEFHVPTLSPSNIICRPASWNSSRFMSIDLAVHNASRRRCSDRIWR